MCIPGLRKESKKDENLFSLFAACHPYHFNLITGMKSTAKFAAN